MRTARPALERAAAHALAYLEDAAEAPVARGVSTPELAPSLGGALPEAPTDPVAVIDDLAAAAAPGLVRTNAGRYFGFVEGGTLPAALAADWLTSVWDQNPAFDVLSPAAAAAEEAVAGWLRELLGLPARVSVGLTTGAQMANVAGLAAARDRVLAEAGWDVEADGLVGAPEVTVVAGAERHATIGRALRLLGLGERRVVEVPADARGRMAPAALARALGAGPTIVCAQAGNVNTGACDPLAAVTDLAGEHGAWVHVDGAFGLWAAASPRHRELVAGAERADSWAVDGHKWLNVPYDCGIVACAHAESHRRAMALSAAYLARSGGRDGSDWSPESSRRARVFTVWAALRSLGREGVADLVDRCCAYARRIATALEAEPGVRVLNDVVLNQVLVSVGDEVRTREVAAAIQAEGVVWLGTTVWQGTPALRISVSDHATGESEVEAVVAAIRRALRPRRRFSGSRG